MQQNYPNPFNLETAIRYSIPQQAEVNLTVYNLRGQKVVTLVNEKHAPGAHMVKWNGRSASGREVANGVYIYKLTAGDFRATRKMVLLR